MEITATNFRKHLFQVLERAVEGETIEITWKGSRLRLSAPPESGSKLANMVKRDVLLAPFDSIVDSDPELMSELEARWARDDKEL